LTRLSNSLSDVNSKELLIDIFLLRPKSIFNIIIKRSSIYADKRGEKVAYTRAEMVELERSTWHTLLNLLKYVLFE